MPATVEIREINAANAAAFTRDPALMAAGASTDKTAGTIRFKQAGNSTVDANNPIPIPASGVNRSFEKVLCFRLVSFAGGTVNINNLRFYTDGTNGWTGVTLAADRLNSAWSGAVAASTCANYILPVGVDSPRATTNAFTRTAAAPLVLAGGGGAGDDVGTGGGTFTAAYNTFHVGNLLYLQMDVGSTAVAGTLAGETLTLSFDEA